MIILDCENLGQSICRPEIMASDMSTCVTKVKVSYALGNTPHAQTFYMDQCMRLIAFVRLIVLVLILPLHAHK